MLLSESILKHTSIKTYKQLGGSLLSIRPTSLSSSSRHTTPTKKSSHGVVLLISGLVVHFDGQRTTVYLQTTESGPKTLRFEVVRAAWGSRMELANFAVPTGLL